MGDLKLHGIEDIARLRERPDTWTPPDTVDDFLYLVRKVISSSKYTDTYLRGAHDHRSISDFQSYLRMKLGRICEFPDVEECVDVAAYAYMLFNKLLLAGG